MLHLLKNAWIQTLIAFDVRDPLKRTDKVYVLPENFTQLDPALKVKATVCNLCANNEQSIDQVAQFYNLSRSDVVSILLAEGIIEDKRRTLGEAIKGGRRETDH